MAKTLRNLFFVLLVLSTIVGCGAMLMLQTSASPSAGPAPAPSAAESNGALAVLGSFATSVISLVGFVVTTVIAWRKEKRESTLAEVERKKLELELEKSKIELEELKKGKQK